MLNRHHVRIKVMQALYSYYINDEKNNISHYEKELLDNIERLYKVYLYLLLLLREITSFAEKYDDEIQSNIPGVRQLNPNSRFYKNSLITALNNHSALDEACRKNAVFFSPDHIEILRKVFVDLKNNEIYREYIHNDKEDIQTDLELFSFFLKYYTINFNLLDSHIEDIFINWPDDAKMAVNMAVKSLKILAKELTNPDIIISLSNDENENIDFGKRLLHVCIHNQPEFDKLIQSKVQKWEPSRLPLLDLIILYIGLSEILYFETIPVKVTINECIELAKNYSTYGSKNFINGVLDNLVKDLNSQGKINKKGIGLIDK